MGLNPIPIFLLERENLDTDTHAHRASCEDQADGSNAPKAKGHQGLPDCPCQLSEGTNLATP